MESQGESLREAPATSGPQPFDPEPFGKYYLLDRIAVGGMAEVFLAKTFGHAGFQKLLVVKRILSRFAEDPAFVEMFVDEAKLTVQLVHPNIVHIHDFGKLGPHWFLAMEAVHGKDLKSIMRRLAERGQRMPLEIAAVIAHETVRGLAYAHSRRDPAGLPLNIVHRDVSPSNVLISYEGGVKIVDFGIAKAETTRDESAERHLLKGKFQYMSPEQTRGDELDQRSDVFAAGICLWEMLTGNRLFRRDDDYEVVQAIRAGEVPLPSSYNPSVPADLERICMKALTVDLNGRYADATAMQRDLQDYLLPATPERLQPSMRGFMEELFADEIGVERGRLQAATAHAEELHYGVEDDLELELEDEAPAAIPAPGMAAPHGSGTLTPPEPSRDKSMLGPLLGLAIVAIAVLGTAWFISKPPPTPTTATLSVLVQPADAPNLVLTLDGAPIESTWDQVTPDVMHTLRITADGFEPREKAIELVAGQVFDTEVVLKPLPAPEPEEPEEPATPAAKKPPPRVEKEPATPRETVAEAAAPPTIAFRSEPEGAKVFVDGRPIGTTPLNWKDGREGSSYNVEFRIKGYQSVQAVVDAPPAGERRRLSRTLQAKEAAPASDEPGKLSVQVSSGWAKVYVDGAYVDTTPLFELKIAPGNYTIRVVNERTGLDRSERVAVKSGEVSRKTFRVDE